MTGHYLFVDDESQKVTAACSYKGNNFKLCMV